MSAGPGFRAARSSIEQGILELQSKIRRRKQLELENELDSYVLPSDRMAQYERELGQLMAVYEGTQTLETPLYNTLNSPSAFLSPPAIVPEPTLNPLLNNQTLESITYDTVRYDPSRWTNAELKERIRKQTLHLQYLRRVEELRRQQQILAGQKNDPLIAILERQNMVRKQKVQKQLLQEELTAHIRTSQRRQPQLSTRRHGQTEFDGEVGKSSRRQELSFSKGSPVRMLNPSPGELRLRNQDTVESSNQRIIGDQNHRSRFDQLQYEEEALYSGEESSSELVEKYFKGVKAQEYYRDLQRLKQLEDKIFENQPYLQPKKVLPILDTRANKSYAFDSPAKSGQLNQQHERTKEKKVSFPASTGAARHGADTIVSHRGSKRDKKLASLSLPLTKSFMSNKMRGMIASQKQSSGKKSHGSFQDRTRPFSAEKAIGSARKSSKGIKSKTMLGAAYGKTVDFSMMGLYPEQKKSKKAYLGKVHEKILQARQKKHHSMRMQGRSRSNTKIKENKEQILIPAPLYPSSESIKFPESFLEKVSVSCSQKIESRLKVSYVMHRDSKMRNNRHEIDHLLSKFTNEAKARRSVKEKINNTPHILRKHKMVVE